MSFEAFITNTLEIAFPALLSSLSQTSEGTYYAAAIAIGLAALATGLAQSRIGAAVAGLVAERPDQSGIGLVLLAIPETIVVLGFVISVMILLGIGA